MIQKYKQAFACWGAQTGSAVFVTCNVGEKGLRDHKKKGKVREKYVSTCKIDSRYVHVANSHLPWLLGNVMSPLVAEHFSLLPLKCFPYVWKGSLEFPVLKRHWNTTRWEILDSSARQLKCGNPCTCKWVSVSCHPPSPCKLWSGELAELLLPEQVSEQGAGWQLQHLLPGSWAHCTRQYPATCKNTCIYIHHKAKVLCFF